MSSKTIIAVLFLSILFSASAFAEVMPDVVIEDNFKIGTGKVLIFQDGTTQNTATLQGVAGPAGEIGPQVLKV